MPNNNEKGEAQKHGRRFTPSTGGFVLRLIKSIAVRVSQLPITLRHAVFPPPRHRLFLVQSTLAADQWIEAPDGQRLYVSSFNPQWFDELGIRPDVIFDVGSYDGGDALHLKRMFPNARVIAVEADPQRADAVRSALRNSGVDVLECAVVDRPGMLDFYPTTIDGVRSSQGSIYRFNRKTEKKLSYIEQASQPIKVLGRPLAEILDDLSIYDVSLLHMDIQGAEYDALIGLRNYRPRMIHLEVTQEYKGAKKLKNLHRLLVSMGYQLAADFINDRLYIRAPEPLK